MSPALPAKHPWRLIRSVGPVGAAARGLAVDAGGRIVAGVSQAGRGQMWRLRSGHSTGPLTEDAQAVAVAPDGRWIAVGTRAGKIQLWQGTPRRLARTLTAHTGGVRAVAFSGDANRLISAGEDGRAVVWEVVSGRSVARFETKVATTTVALSGDGTLAVTGHLDGLVVTWDVNQARRKERLAGHQGRVTALALHPEGSLLVSGGQDGTARLWALPATQPRHVWKGHQGALTAVALSEDGRWVLSGGADHTARLWRTHTGAPLAVLRLPSRVSAVSLTEGGRLSLVAGPGLRIRVYESPRLIR